VDKKGKTDGGFQGVGGPYFKVILISNKRGGEARVRVQGGPLRKGRVTIKTNSQGGNNPILLTWEGNEQRGGCKQNKKGYHGEKRVKKVKTLLLVRGTHVGG